MCESIPELVKLFLHCAKLCQVVNRRNIHGEDNYMHQLIRLITSATTTIAITNNLPFGSSCFSTTLKNLLFPHHHQTRYISYSTSLGRQFNRMISSDEYSNNKGGPTNGGPPTGISTVFFDLDNTLIATRKADTKACNRVSLIISCIYL